MKRTVSIKRFLLVAVICLGFFLSLQIAQSKASTSYAYTDPELDRLLAPIALYPDPLLAQMLPASTYPAEIADAEDWLNRGGDVSRMDGQDWDESVKTIAHYPDILNMMAAYLDWTADLGEAFLNQPEDVTRSIQRLRWQARNVGNLESTAQQTVMIDGDYIEIIPAQPQYVYVPQYDPSAVYTERWISGGSPFVTFGLGFLIGSWLSMDFDWHYHRIVYHGWNRPGWVNHARPHVRVRDVYVNRSRPDINQAWRHDPSRGGPARYRASSPGHVAGAGTQARMAEVRGRSTMSSKPLEGIFGPRGNAASLSNRGKESRGIIPGRPAAPGQAVKRPPSAPVPVVVKGPTQSSSAGPVVKPPKAPLAPVVGREVRVTSPAARPVAPGQAVKRPPSAPVPVVVKGPTQSSSAGPVVKPPKAPLAPVVGREVRVTSPAARPAAPGQAVKRPPSAPDPAMVKGPSQVHSIREGQTPGKTPSVAFGGYRGANESKVQSLRGQASRQTAVQERPAAEPVKKGGSPAKANAAGGKQR